MKLKRVTFYFIDRDNVDNEEVPSLLQDCRFPNRCISPEQITVEETDIGEWSDEHRCNCPDYDLSREFNERGWIPVENGLPEERQEVLITIKTDYSYGRGTEIAYEVDVAIFHKESGYIGSACGNGFFDTDNDWDEGQPICVIAWMPKPTDSIFDERSF